MRFPVRASGAMLDRLRPVLPRVRRVVGFATDALVRLEGTLAGASPQPESGSPQGPPSEEDPADIDEKVVAVREARRAAIARRDTGLADRLTMVEEHLLHRERSSRSAPLVSARDRTPGTARLEDIRKQLLANTPRPDGAEDDDDSPNR